MRSAYPAVFFCALACASAPSASRLSSTGAQPMSVSLPVADAAGSGRGKEPMSDRAPLVVPELS